MIPHKNGGMFLKNAKISITFAKILNCNGRFDEIQGFGTNADPSGSEIHS